MKRWNLEPSEWLGKADAELCSPELAEAFRELDLKVLNSDTPGSAIDVAPLPDGRVCSLLSHKFAIQLPNGERLVAGTRIDISEQKEAEKRTLQALAEKESLLKEVHHRVKNNLQVICSLLNMQAGTLREGAALAALRDSHDRVLSMALIHELLYGSSSMKDFDFSE